jgi:hypothetical protein
MKIELIITIYCLIALSGSAIAECVKRMYKTIKAYQTLQNIKTIDLHPVLIFIIIAIIDIPATIFFTLFGVKEIWALSFSIPLVYSVSIIGYDSIIKVLLEIPELIKMLLKRFILGNEKEIVKEKEFIFSKNKPTLD